MDTFLVIIIFILFAAILAFGANYIGKRLDKANDDKANNINIDKKNVNKKIGDEIEDVEPIFKDLIEMLRGKKDFNKKSFTRLVWQLVWYISFAVWVIFTLRGGIGEGVGAAGFAFTLTWILWAIIVWLYWGFGENEEAKKESELKKESESEKESE